MTTMTTGAAAVGTAAGTAIPRATPTASRRGGKSEAVASRYRDDDDDDRALPLRSRDEEAGSPARDRVIAVAVTTMKTWQP